MKALLVSLLLIAFTQGAKATPIDLDEMHSKYLYNLLAGYGLRTPEPAMKRTDEWAKPAVCAKVVNGMTTYLCAVHDQFHNVNVSKTGAEAKKLYDVIAMVNTPICSGARCDVRTDEIKCIHNWPDKNNPPRYKYWCSIDKWYPIPPAAN